MNRRKKLRWWFYILATCLTASAVLVSISSFYGFKFLQPEKKHVWVDISQEEDSLDASSEKNGKWYGLCKKNSIQSVNDFRKAVADDNSLKIHFADFRWDQATMQRLDKPIYAYVYFRKDGRLFQKIQPIKLPVGDQYITDGKTRVRTHCCNNYEEAPPLVESLIEPASELGEEPLPSAPKLALLPTNADSAPPFFISTPNPSSSEGGVLPYIPPIIVTKEDDDNPLPPAPPQPSPPQPISEPRSGLLLLVGLITTCLALVTWHSRGKLTSKGE